MALIHGVISITPWDIPAPPSNRMDRRSSATFFPRSPPRFSHFISSFSYLPRVFLSTMGPRYVFIHGYYVGSAQFLNPASHRSRYAHLVF